MRNLDLAIRVDRYIAAHPEEFDMDTYEAAALFHTMVVNEIAVSEAAR